MIETTEIPTAFSGIIGLRVVRSASYSYLYMACTSVDAAGTYFVDMLLYHWTCF